MARLLVVLCVLLMATGCGGGERESTAGDAARRFLAAVGDGQLARACAMLSPRTRDDLLADAPDCAGALGSEQLSASPVSEVSVWGDRAQVRTEAGTLFLAEFDDGWKVVAAGCRPRGEQPYLCAVGG